MCPPFCRPRGAYPKCAFLVLSLRYFPINFSLVLLRLYYSRHFETACRRCRTPQPGINVYHACLADSDYITYAISTKRAWASAWRNPALFPTLLIDFSTSHTVVCFGRNDKALFITYVISSGGMWYNEIGQKAK